MGISYRRVFLIIFVLVGIGFSSVFSFSYIKNTQKTKEMSNSLKSGSANNIAVVQTAESKTLPKVETSNVHSPDGKMELVMDKTLEESVNSYSLYTCEVQCVNKSQILTISLPKDQSIDLPLNSWSPNNKYVFVRKTGGAAIAYWVFNADGQAFANGNNFIDVVPAFDAKQTGNNLGEVTGWDSNTLLHVFSNLTDGTRGPSYWFEVPSQAVIRLASR
ncbi:MAG TPA: hypothetical protein VG917_00615 [Patescibacteria group bacterium]|nr:hypothetical protein [Patescibacteria group bacterium]